MSVAKPFRRRACGALLRKELTVSLTNGILWGAVVGMLALVMCFDFRLGAVMSGAVMLNLVVACTVGSARAARPP